MSTLPQLLEVDTVEAPAAPKNLDETGVAPEFLFDLTVKIACTRVQFTTD
ncbi:MAG: hypothetical protein JSS02_27665 [Planctomycetes bacterium]|nr:hypothetical protein [Planctomycetota bacterium]